MDMPLSVVDTRTELFGCRAYIDELIPNCKRCIVIGSSHKKTQERGFFAFCKRSGKLERVGPYKSYHEALKVLVQTKGCDSCNFNVSKLKEAYIPILDEQFKLEMEALYGTEQSFSVVLNPVCNFFELRKFLDLNFEVRFGFKLFLPLTDDGVAFADLAKPCSTPQMFALKIQA